MNEKEIVEKCQKGDQSAMRELYNFYLPKMRGICLRYVRTDFEVEDILQEAFIKVFTNIKSYNFQGQFGGWVRRIVVNTAINYYWSNEYLNKQIAIENVNESEMEAVEIADKLSVDELYGLINKLPEGYRFVFNMYAIDGYSHKEVGEILNIAESASRSQYSRAKQSLIQLINKQKYVKDER